MNNYLKYDYKFAFLDKIFEQFPAAQVIKVLDLGSGTSKDFVQILNKYPNIHYTGIEYRRKSLEKARVLLGDNKNVSLLNNFGEKTKGQFEDHFDVTLSLSVLEHVKNLSEFLLTSVFSTKPGGYVIHRYDLGHALHSDSMLEIFKVWLCKNYPILIPASRFTTHPSQIQIVEILKNAGIEIQNIVHSQLPSLKALINNIDWRNDCSTSIGKQIIDIDEELAQLMVSQLDISLREQFFPTITIYGRKL
jgi:trans-aconitate methyltransferase